MLQRLSLRCMSWATGVVALHLSAAVLAAGGDIPRSFALLFAMRDIPTIEVRGPDASLIAEMDRRSEGEGRPPAYGVVLPVGVDAMATGVWHKAPGGRILRLRVRSADAVGMELFLEDVYLPEGADVFVYDEFGQQIFGAFTAGNVRSSGRFTTAQQMGGSCILEVYEPYYAFDQCRLRIAEIGHAFRQALPERADACEVDVNCSEGAAWTDQRDGVVRIGTRVNGALYWCTGSLVNNTALDCRSFYLTALHCGLGSTASDLEDYKFYFNYQRPSCGSGIGLTVDVITGCHRRADSNDGGGVNGSDFLLLEGLDPVPASFSPFWNGWDATGPGSSSGVCIHHPTGSEKKISTYAMNLLTTQWVAGGPYSHWYVKWTSTLNGHGVTELGSSGSPLFNADGRIIGTLTGGTSCCVVDGCNLPGSGPTEPDYFGKMQYHWTQNPNAVDQKLQAWLDPLATGVTLLEGSRDPCANSVPSNGASDLEVFPVPCAGTLTLTDRAAMLIGSSLEVVDAAGQVVWRSDWKGASQMHLDLSEFPDGIYVLRARTENHRFITVRFVILR